MRKLILIFLLSYFVLFTSLIAQDKVPWSPNIEITYNSFKATPPNMGQDHIQQYIFACTWDFSFQMANIQFAFTKNFNKYVDVYYVPSLSWMEEGELTEQLLLMANLDFDLTELYARKFRKELYEAKKMGSNINFFNDLHRKVNAEYANHRTQIQSHVMASNTSDDAMTFLHAEIQKVNTEIETLNEYCKLCKPQKRKKKRKK